MASLKFQSRWDKTVFYGSIIGSIIILFLTFFKCRNNTGILRENDRLKKENTLLKMEVEKLQKK